ncbi:unnamed protein product [Brassica oleracea]|uniref:Uncharacterized protein n=2 Tax=Brassica oleracea TaxID=3712 RepID=A0A0D3CCK6_BRAOL|nr:unnamed protein product [Brassica oleracea]
MVVDYRINEDEFHKISLLDCDFFIRKPPDLDNDVYDFREMYVTPPDTDIYSIPRLLAPMPQKAKRERLWLLALCGGALGHRAGQRRRIEGTLKEDPSPARMEWAI